jgi:hypothetical protein
MIVYLKTNNNILIKISKQYYRNFNIKNKISKIMILIVYNSKIKT